MAQDSPGPKFGRAQSFDFGWLFFKGDGHGFEAPGFDDSAWRLVDVPHDWSIENLPAATGAADHTIMGPFDKAAIGQAATGFTVGGIGWYRKRFGLATPTAASVELLFEGVYQKCDIWLNGHQLASSVSGYTPFARDLTPYLDTHGDNVLALRVRNEGENSRWYAGSGLYRHVWLDVLPERARIARWGVGIITRRIEGGIAGIDITTRLEEIGEGLVVRSRIKRADGMLVWSGQTTARAEINYNAQIRGAELWSPETPNLYVLETELCRGERVIDRLASPFGVRIISFDVARGTLLNGQPIKLRGGCIHHDHGIIGAAAFDGAEERKVRLLRARGFNAVRTSHNQFSPGFLSACDRHGLMVLADTFDCWQVGKLPNDYSQDFAVHWKTDLSANVLSSRNHPSIIMWCIGNEIPKRNSTPAIEMQWLLTNEVHRLDPSRPVTAAVNDFEGRLVIPTPLTARSGTAGIPDQASVVFLDIAGYNYKLSRFEADHATFPKRLMVSTESFPKDVFSTWEVAERSPYLLGDFVWTAMDYLGEAGIGACRTVPAKAAGSAAPVGAWPMVNAACGDLDIIGRQKGGSLARDVVWGVSRLEIAVQKPISDGGVESPTLWGWSDERPSWTWPGAEGRHLAVRVYARAERVDLLLNGQVLESRTSETRAMRHEFQVPYAAGRLEAVGFVGGKEIARKALQTAGAPAAISLRLDASTLRASRANIHYVEVEITDAKGLHSGDVTRELTLAISGPVTLLGFGSGVATAVTGFQSATARTHDGRALVVLRGTGASGHVHLEMSAPGLTGATASMNLV